METVKPENFLERGSVRKMREAVSEIPIHFGISVEQQTPYRSPQLEQSYLDSAEPAVRESGELEKYGFSSGFENTMDLSERAVQIRGVPERIRTRDNVEGVIAERDLIHIAGLKTQIAVSEFFPGPGKHLRGEVEPHDPSFRIPFRKRSGELAGSTRQVQNPRSAGGGKPAEKHPFPNRIKTERQYPSRGTVSAGNRSEQLQVVSSLAFGAVQVVVFNPLMQTKSAIQGTPRFCAVASLGNGGT